MSIQGARLHQTGGAIHRSGAVVNDLFHDARQRVAGSRIDVYAPQVADLERTPAGHRLGRFASFGKRYRGTQPASAFCLAAFFCASFSILLR